MSRLPPITVFDVETTGLDPRRGHRVIELAGVRIEDGRVREDKIFASLVNPEREIPLEAKQIHQISDEEVAGAPLIATVLPKFLEFASGSMLFAHNASFDHGFLEAEKAYCWGYIDVPPCFCTMRLSQSLYPREFRHNLDVVCHRFNLEYPTDRHRALGDAILTAQALVKMVDAAHFSSLDELKQKASVQAFARVLGRAA